MKRERRLHLVPPPSAPVTEGAGGGDEPPFTEDELREATALREAMDRGDAPVASILRAAWTPAPLDEGDLDAILARALPGDGAAEAPPTRLEREAAARLAGDLERGGDLPEDEAILGDLRAAYRPGEISPARNEELIERALRTARRKPSSVRRALPVTMAALASVAALAAGVAVMIGQVSRSPAPVAAAALIHARSTDGLFDPAKKFEVGEQSARIDRIATARAADLRQNRFAAWGVR